MSEYKNLLVGVDGSEQSKMAVQKAIDIAKRNNAKLHLLSIVNGERYPNTSTVGYGFVDRDIYKKATDEMTKELAEMKKKRKRVYYPVLELQEELSKMDLDRIFDDFTYAVNTVLKKKSLDEDFILLDDVREQTDFLARELTFNTLEKYLEIFYEMRKYITLGININKDTVTSSLLLRLTEV